MIEGNSQATDQTGGSMAKTAKIRLLIAEDHTVVRYTLRSLLEQYPEIEIVGEANNGLDAVSRAEELQPAIVLMDINMPNLDGVAATQRIKARWSRMAVLGLSVHGERRSIDAMLRAGALDVIPKERATEELYEAIRRAIDNTQTGGMA